MSYQDKNIPCSDCTRSFIFSAEEQGLSGELGYDEPKRCPACRLSLEYARREPGGGDAR